MLPVLTRTARQGVDSAKWDKRAQPVAERAIEQAKQLFEAI
jgi:hypothetical protein